MIEQSARSFKIPANVFSLISTILSFSGAVMGSSIIIGYAIGGRRLDYNVFNMLSAVLAFPIAIVLFAAALALFVLSLVWHKKSIGPKSILILNIVGIVVAVGILVTSTTLLFI